MYQSDLHVSQHLFANIMMASQYVHVTPGLSSQTQTQLSNLLQEISQGVSTVTVHLRKQRDAASREREEEHERYKRASHESDLYKKSLDELRRLNVELETQVANVGEREKLLKNHIRDLKQQLNHTQKQLDALTADALRFHSHHDKVLSDYKQQDEKHFKAITVS
jgi:chromosome segregation ATPase